MEETNHSLPGPVVALVVGLATASLDPLAIFDRSCLKPGLSCLLTLGVQAREEQVAVPSRAASQTAAQPDAGRGNGARDDGIEAEDEEHQPRDGPGRDGDHHSPSIDMLAPRSRVRDDL